MFTSILQKLRENLTTEGIWTCNLWFQSPVLYPWTIRSLSENGDIFDFIQMTILCCFPCWILGYLQQITNYPKPPDLLLIQHNWLQAFSKPACKEISNAKFLTISKSCKFLYCIPNILTDITPQPFEFARLTFPDTKKHSLYNPVNKITSLSQKNCQSCTINNLEEQISGKISVARHHLNSESEEFGRAEETDRNRKRKSNFLWVSRNVFHLLILLWLHKT